MRPIAALFPRLHIAACIAGYYAPGVEEIFQSIVLKMYFEIFIAAIFFSCFGKVVGSIRFLVLAPESTPKGILFNIIRGCLLNTYWALKAIFIYRRDCFGKLFKPWTDPNLLLDESTDFNLRQKFLEERIKTYYKRILPAMVLSAVPVTFNGIYFLTSRHVKGAQFVYLPHDPESPLHFYFASFLFIVHMGIFMSLFYETFTVLNFSMLASQLEYMGVCFADIINTISVSNSGNVLLKQVCHKSGDYRMNVLYAKMRLRKWLKVYENTRKWIHEMASYYSYVLTLKYFFLAFYTITIVYTLPNYVKRGLWNDVIMNLMYAYGMFSLQFYVTRVIDDVTDSSQALTDAAYGNCWYTYPKEFQRMFLCISFYTKNRPVRFKWLFIFYDNTKSFLEILQIAYQGLSILWQMDEK